jgi:hypothetical protein
VDERPHLGPVIIDPEMGDWHWFQRRMFRAGEFDLAKIHISPAFNTSVSHVADLNADGAAGASRMVDGR